jgi:AAA domain
MKYRLESLADLLREPDPGPTPMLVEGLLAANAVGAIVGPYKAAKTWLGLEIAASVATGRPAFGELAVQSGPVVLVLEESSRSALHRRMDALRRGRAQEAEAFEPVRFSANQRVRLDDPTCRKWLLGEVEQIRPVLTIADPLVRLKGADTDENDQRQIGRVLDFFAELRDASGGTVLFAHHIGHNGRHARGSSDIEAAWESKLTLHRRDGKRYLRAEHRDAEPTDEVGLRLSFDDETRSVRLLLDRANPAGQDAASSSEAKSSALSEADKTRIRELHAANVSGTQIHKLLHKSRPNVLAYIKTLEGGPA